MSRLSSIALIHAKGRAPQRGQPFEACTAAQSPTQSCASRFLSIWHTALPIHNVLTLSNTFCNAFQFKRGLTPLPLEATRVRCGCGAVVDSIPPWVVRTPFSTPNALDLASVLPFRVVRPRSRASSSSWSVPFGVSRGCLCCYTYSYCCVSL